MWTLEDKEETSLWYNLRKTESRGGHLGAHRGSWTDQVPGGVQGITPGCARVWLQMSGGHASWSSPGSVGIKFCPLLEAAFYLNYYLVKLDVFKTCQVEMMASPNFLFENVSH